MSTKFEVYTVIIKELEMVFVKYYAPNHMI